MLRGVMTMSSRVRVKDTFEEQPAPFQPALLARVPWTSNGWPLSRATRAPFLPTPLGPLASSMTMTRITAHQTHGLLRTSSSHHVPVWAGSGAAPGAGPGFAMARPSDQAGALDRIGPASLLVTPMDGLASAL